MTSDIETRLRAAAARNGRPPSDAAAERFASRALSEGLVDVAYAHIDSPVGDLLAAVTPRGLVTLSYLGFRNEDAVLGRLADRVSPRVLEAPARLDGVRRELDEYFEGRRREFGVAVDLALVTEFQGRILRATAAIPYGRHLSYTEVAAQAGSPRASRAAGNALGANPIPIVIPCHRVWAAGGRLGGYTGGLDRKRLLLELEGALQPELG
ncbi:MAG: methylated-DNA-[protein]-cysteine S-methyltransferase [Thermoleophilaceae bacterium]|jgi:methylated-DNA-[protein]-cysteine S-methyltransferase|nr:methylated-DNA-[protein]-cysteine S-methyltransferase [Thermoleophilaceae bacterium]